MRQKARFLFKKIPICRFLCFLLCLFVITGCETKTDGETIKENKGNEKKENQSGNLLSSAQSINLAENEYYERSIDWLDDDRVLFLASDGNSSFLRSYQLYNGEIQNIVETQVPIFDVSVDPSRKFLLVVQSPVANQMEVSIFTVEGEKLYTATLPGVDLIHEWNNHVDGKLYVSSFYEDWSFRSYVIDVNKKVLEEFAIDHPFARWIGKNELGYIDWDLANPSLSAPLMTIDDSGKKNRMLESVVSFNLSKTVLVAVMENSKEELAEYEILDRSFSKIANFSLPVLKGYSEWMIPALEINESKKSIITIAPYETAIADTYKDSFSLVQYNWQDRKKKVILDHVGFSNIACAPDGDSCLIGERLEILVDVNQSKQKKIYSE
jgi:hypothetical protein